MKILTALPAAMLLLSFETSPVIAPPWNEESTDSLGTVVTAHSLGEFHSSVHYDLTKLLAVKIGLSPDTAEIIARFCALVDQINPKPDYPYTFSLNSTSIPDTFPNWPESLAGTERGGLNSNAQNEFTAQYWHFPFRDPSDSLTGMMVWGTYPAANNFEYYTGPPYFWRVPITYNLKHIMQWALYNGGDPGLPDLLTPVQVMYTDATHSAYQVVQPNSIQAFGIFLHSLADSYSHEECMVADTMRAHPSSDPYCGLTYHSEHEFAYDANMRAKIHADSCAHAIWRALREFKRVRNITTPELWTTDNNGFQDGDGIPDQLEDDGDTDYTETFLEQWKNPAASDLNGDGVINHSDHTTWRIYKCNLETGIPDQPGAITGPASVCQNSVNSYSISAVPGATSYTWTLPSGWSGNSTTTSISTTAGGTSGNVSVAANNSSGPGPSQSLSVTVYEVPLQYNLTNINILTGHTVCYNASQTITVAGNNTTFIVRNGGSATMIAGQYIDFLPGAKVISGGYLHGYISSNGECCLEPGRAPEVIEYQAFVDNGNKPQEPLAGHTFFKVYPNPASDKFFVEIVGDYPSSGMIVEVFGFRGEKVLTKALTSEWKHEFSLPDEPAGIYFVRIVAGDKIETIKLVKRD